MQGGFQFLDRRAFKVDIVVSVQKVSVENAVSLIIADNGCVSSVVHSSVLHFASAWRTSAQAGY